MSSHSPHNLRTASAVLLSAAPSRSQPASPALSGGSLLGSSYSFAESASARPLASPAVQFCSASATPAPRASFSLPPSHSRSSTPQNPQQEPPSPSRSHLLRTRLVQHQPPALPPRDHRRIAPESTLRNCGRSSSSPDPRCLASPASAKSLTHYQPRPQPRRTDARAPTLLPAPREFAPLLPHPRSAQRSPAPFFDNSPTPSSGHREDTAIPTHPAPPHSVPAPETSAAASTSAHTPLPIVQCHAHLHSSCPVEAIARPTRRRSHAIWLRYQSSGDRQRLDSATSRQPWSSVSVQPLPTTRQTKRETTHDKKNNSARKLVST